MFDIVIPVGPDELDIIQEVVSTAKLNIKGYNNIYLISCDPTLSLEGCITIEESIFPFSIKSIEEIHGESFRTGWFYQQLLKLYAAIVIPNCLETILILDADVFVLRELEFLQDGKPIFTVGYEYTQNYHIHSQKLHPSIVRATLAYSGVSHHMVLGRSYILEIFKLVEDYHNNKEVGKPFWQIFIECLDSKDGVPYAQCSEYEIYFNYMCIYHPDKILLRELKWDNVEYLTDNVKQNYHYASVPKYLGTR